MLYLCDHVRRPYPLLTCKLILNLRRTAHAQDGGTIQSVDHPKSIQEIAFASGALLGDFGAPLQSVLDDGDGEDNGTCTYAAEEEVPHSTEMQMLNV